MHKTREKFIKDLAIIQADLHMSIFIRHPWKLTLLQRMIEAYNSR
jgi:hypothetical protein